MKNLKVCFIISPSLLSKIISGILTVSLRNSGKVSLGTRDPKPQIIQVGNTTSTPKEGLRSRDHKIFKWDPRARTPFLFFFSYALLHYIEHKVRVIFQKETPVRQSLVFNL